jgi:hypothetical protein
LLVVPRELALMLGLELVVERFGIVVVGDTQYAPRRESTPLLEDLLVPLRGWEWA